MIQIREMMPGEEDRVSALIVRVFDEFVAPDLTEEGLTTFHEYASVEGLRQKFASDYFFLLAEMPDTAAGLVGMIGMHGCTHLSLLFVDARHQQKGIARALFEAVLERCEAQMPELTSITVNSSPYAVKIYERLGFRAEGPEQIMHGIRFTPMRAEV